MTAATAIRASSISVRIFNPVQRLTGNTAPLCWTVDDRAALRISLVGNRLVLEVLPIMRSDGSRRYGGQDLVDAHREELRWGHTEVHENVLAPGTSVGQSLGAGSHQGVRPSESRGGHQKVRTEFSSIRR
ncbi:hypothetical protein ACFVKB_07510 [Rhodococcus sp. NPDC127530]|uniref:hypothetical protein n=1 Tax=unclassified Rhodococcus (in: high G+C Gram-positive bacteria) TaxID=192944 RepID=UPI0036250195